jgi:uncharacterized protein YdeI (YjbR/CyaY-like superfamily)
MALTRRAPTKSKKSDLLQIPGIGKTFVADLARISVCSINQLIGMSPELLFKKLKHTNDAERHNTSKNYLYVLRMAIYYANGGRDETLLKWSAWSDAKVKRKSSSLKLSERESFEPDTRKDWRAWLKKNHKTSDGVWLILRKKNSNLPRVDLESACEELVCFGWVDSRPAKLDSKRSKLLCTPRREQSAWSKLNKNRYDRMTAQGKIEKAGQIAAELAKKNGRWSALDDVEKLVIPSELKKELSKYKGASKNFDAFPPSARRGILEWIMQAKKPETRADRIAKTAKLAASNERANQWPRPLANR